MPNGGKGRSVQGQILSLVMVAVTPACFSRACNERSSFCSKLYIILRSFTFITQMTWGVWGFCTSFSLFYTHNLCLLRCCCSSDQIQQQPELLYWQLDSCWAGSCPGLRLCCGTQTRGGHAAFPRISLSNPFFSELSRNVSTDNFFLSNLPNLLLISIYVYTNCWSMQCLPNKFLIIFKRPTS